MPAVLGRRKKFSYRETGDTEGEGDEKTPAVLDQHKLEPKDTKNSGSHQKLAARKDSSPESSEKTLAL